MAMGMPALLSGLWAGLLRLGWCGPLLQATLPSAHGPLMVCGFLGTLISLGRAVALDRTWTFLAPAATGIGGMLTLAGGGRVRAPFDCGGERRTRRDLRGCAVDSGRALREQGVEEGRILTEGWEQDAV